jgi:uncharacterized iron-regulated membrane protein
MTGLFSSPLALRRWTWLHKWSSLVCTAFMLLLCLTGLPLVFYHEIDHALGKHIEAPRMAADLPHLPADEIVRAARGHHAHLVPLYLFREEDDPDLWVVKMDTRPDTDETKARFSVIDARNGSVLGEPRFDEGVMHLMYRLHVDLFAGLAGRLFLGFMGLLLVLSLLSGVVLYAPFMRRLDFGEVRRRRSGRLWWLDMHNMLGIVTLTWALVIGATGVINTWADVILKVWQAEQIAALKVAAPAPRVSARARQVSLQSMVDAALRSEPGMAVATIAFPGTLLSSPSHFAVFLHGDTPLTSRLLKAVLVDPASGQVMETPPRPWYVSALLLSQPLHFGDYGGLPLKVLWALLDLITVVVLWSGLVLWWRKHRAAGSAKHAPGAVAGGRA